MRIKSLFHKKKSKEVAKDRLKILLIKKDIAKVLSRYIQIDPGKMEIEVSKRKINVFW